MTVEMHPPHLGRRTDMSKLYHQRGPRGAAAWHIEAGRGGRNGQRMAETGRREPPESVHHWRHRWVCSRHGDDRYRAGEVGHPAAIEALRDNVSRMSRCGRRPGVTRGQNVEVVTKYLRDHPEHWHQPMAAIVFVALREACPEWKGN